MITTKLAQFLPQDDSWSWILQLIWIVFFIAYMLYGQRIQVWNMLFEIKRSVKELESLRNKAKKIVIEAIRKINGTQIDPTPVVDRFLDYVTIQPQDMDPAGVVWKLEHILNVRESRFRDEVKMMVPNAEKTQINNLEKMLEVAQTLNSIYKTVRHYYLLGRKTMSLYIIMQLDMQLPQFMKQAKAYMSALEAFALGQPIGDGAGALTAAKLMKGFNKTLIAEETVMAEVPLEGRKAYIIKAEGPGATVGKPGEAIKKILERNNGKISAIITVDAALKYEGEENGEVADGVGVAIGGYGVERFKVEENMLKHKVPVYSVVIKENLEQAISPMRKEIVDAAEKAVERVKLLVRERTREGDAVIIAGIGNTVGIGQ